MTGFVLPAGEGKLAWPEPPGLAEGSYRVSGGVGGLNFQWQELLNASARLAAVAEDAAGVYSELLLVQTVLHGPRLFLVPGRLLAQDAVSDSMAQLAVSLVEIRRLAEEVEAAHARYRLAEAAAAWGMDQLNGSTWWLSTPIGALANEGRPTLDGAERLVNHGPAALLQLLGVPPVMAGLLLKTVPGGRTAEGRAAVLVHSANSFGLLRAAPVAAKRACTAEPREVELAPTAAALLERAEAAADAGPGTIEILEVPSPEGTRWVVTLPGTQTSGSAEASANPFDETGVAEALAANSRHTAAAVSDALAEAGAAAGEPVVLVGYSQGGMHAVNLAADEDFRARHNVEYVVTAGSPVGGVALPPGTRGLHLEHEQDWVPGADGQANPDTRDRVTVTLTDKVSTPPGEDGGLGPGHDFANYVAGARLLETSTDASVADSAAALGTVLAGGGAARQHLFTLRRQPPPKPKPLPVPFDFMKDRRVPYDFMKDRPPAPAVHSLSGISNPPPIIWNPDQQRRSPSQPPATRSERADGGAN
ncbi:hypothetical protein [Crystallibacter crystallopoietes]|uniref:hypothetical protein n=1 Tax=Crystallibacter crystallopoietes TaxID=37928 RepID=UPI001237331D|nr:hypothetical protein [Arthrobacter crystallopoietes]